MGNCLLGSRLAMLSQRYHDSEDVLEDTVRKICPLAGQDGLIWRSELLDLCGLQVGITKRCERDWFTDSKLFSGGAGCGTHQNIRVCCVV